MITVFTNGTTLYLEGYQPDTLTNGQQFDVPDMEWLYIKDGVINQYTEEEHRKLYNPDPTDKAEVLASKLGDTTAQLAWLQARKAYLENYTDEDALAFEAEKLGQEIGTVEERLAFVNSKIAELQGAE